MAVLLFAGVAAAQDGYGPPVEEPPAVLVPLPTMPAPSIGTEGSDLPLNPAGLLGSAAQVASGGREGPVGFSAVLNIMVLLTVIALAPSIMLMTTCFVRIIVVLSLLRQAIGTQTLPPSQVIMALSLFMTFLVMAPTIERVYDEAVVPFREGQIADYETLWERGKQPLRDFMFDQIEATGNWSSLYMVLEYRGVDISRPELLKRADVDMVSLVPAFMLSELKTAFLMGFRVYLPFLVIDMVISSLLISMSMMMLPPVLISMPFKLLLFVLVDGWQLVVGNLMTSFAQPARTAAATADIGVVLAAVPIPGLTA